MVQVDELVADLTEVFEGLVVDGSLELVTRNGAAALAEALVEHFEEEPSVDLEEWLLEREEVVELFTDSSGLGERMRPVLTRIQKGDPPPRWNPELVAAILAAPPGDDNPWLVFSDWLQQEGDPRGELIAIQAQLRRSPPPAPADAERLRRDQDSLFARFRSHFFGALPQGEEGYPVTFRLGFFETARIDGADVDTLLALHGARFLRSLVVPRNVGQASVALNAEGVSLPPTLVEARFGIVRRMIDERASFTLGPAWRAHPRLERLFLVSETLSIEEPLDFPRLERLILHARILGRQGPAATPVRWKLPALRELGIFANTLSEANRAAILELFRDPPPQLQTLRLGGAEHRDELLTALIASPLLRQLRVLDLKRTGLSDESLLVENTEAFAHLDELDLRKLYFRGRESIVAPLAKNVRLGWEGVDDEDDDEDDDEPYDDQDDYEGEEGWDDSTDIPNEDEHSDPEEEEEDEERQEEREERDHARPVDHEPPPDERPGLEDDDDGRYEGGIDGVAPLEEGLPRPDEEAAEEAPESS